MKYLIFCLFASPSDGTVKCPSAVDGHQIDLVEHHGLCAVCEETSGMTKSPSEASLLSYHKVIESFFEQTTVVPFRFGTVLNDRGAVERYLENRADYYNKILEELENCVEMGMRAIVAPIEQSKEHRDYRQESPRQGIPTGKQYLQTRKELYAAESWLTERNQGVSDRIRDSFSGMFRQFRCESPRVGHSGDHPDAMILSLYFLVPRNVVNEFRKAFAQLVSRESCRLLLSGPWPPYNFVSPSEESTNNASFVLPKLI